MLQIRSLNKSINRLKVFEQYNATIEPHRSCIFGENGIGKTTLLCIIAGIEDYQSGALSIHTAPLDKPLALAALASDAVVYPPFLTAHEVILLNQHTFACHAPDTLIEGFSLRPHLNKPVSALSSGNLKKVQLCCALMRVVKLYLLDEPSAYLDELSIAFLFSVLKPLKGQVLVTSNEPELFEKQGFVTRHLHNWMPCE